VRCERSLTRDPTDAFRAPIEWDTPRALQDLVAHLSFILGQLISAPSAFFELNLPLSGTTLAGGPHLE
jgi:hypothetical protein